MKKPKNKKSLSRDFDDVSKHLKNASFEEKEAFFNKVPLRVRIKVYADSANNDQLIDLLREWKEKGLSDWTKMLKKELKRKHKHLTIPDKELSDYYHRGK